MKANELRIGNYINYITAENDTLLAKIDWQCFGWISQDEKGFNIVHLPIELNEKWLLDFGFKKNNNEWGNEIECFELHKDELFYTGGEGVKFGAGLKYVHQLQNLYFTLTGEELIVEGGKLKL